MRKASSALRNPVVISIVIGCAIVSAGCPTMGPAQSLSVEVRVTGDGEGVGRVVSTEPSLPIDCLVGPNVPDGGEGTCSEGTIDAGGGGAFSLIAEANPGNTFAGWSGCTEFNGTECFLSFTGEEMEVDFDIVATFDVDPTNVCNQTFGTSDGYFLCSEDATSCTFYTRLNDIDSCNTRCASFDSTCLGSILDTEDTCTQGEVGSCDDIVGDRLCQCSKP